MRTYNWLKGEFKLPHNDTGKWECILSDTTNLRLHGEESFALFSAFYKLKSCKIAQKR